VQDEYNTFRKQTEAKGQSVRGAQAEVYSHGRYSRSGIFYCAVHPSFRAHDTEAKSEEEMKEAVQALVGMDLSTE